MLNSDKIKEFNEILHSLGIRWQVYSILILYLIINVISLFFRWEIAVLLLILLGIVVYYLLNHFDNIIRKINAMANDLSNIAREVQEDSLHRAPIGVLIYDESKDNRVRWVNPTMQHIFGSTNLIGQQLYKLEEDFEVLLALPDDRQWHIVEFRDRYYRVMNQLDSNSLYFIDVTQEMIIREQRKQDQLVFGYIFLDDYNEITESMDDQQASSFEAMIINDLSDWSNSNGIYLKRIDTEKFLILLNQQILDKLEKNKFKYFDEWKEKNLLRNVPLSISLGIAYPESEEYNIDQLSDQAQLNLDLALGRGGDQVVVRSENNRARFYGGKTNPSERRSSIQSRLVFQALKTSIAQADNVIITGHKRPDMDSIGSAIGIFKIVRQFKTKANIVVKPEDFNSDVRELLSMKEASVFWDRNILIDIEEAQELATDNTLIIMVDHHRPSLSEAESLINDHDVVIIDHHRRGEEFPENTVLTYIEPYASSTSELITEFFMNMRNTTESVNKFEATALLAGVIVDTNNFSSRTGSRTFDVASYLKSRGANTTHIQRLMKEDFQKVIQRNKLIERSEFIEPSNAVVRGDDDKIIDNMTAAQTADALLDIHRVEASFVIYRRSEEEIGISARSLGTINVQTIMERLGGGGHLSNAATQIKDVTIDEAYQQLEEQLEQE